MKTESIISVLFAILFTCGYTQAQEQKPYKQAAMFKMDTLQYLEYNYNVVRSAEYYKGKTVGDVLRELEYPVLYIVETAFLSGPNMQTKLAGLSLGIRKIGKEPSPLEDYYLYVGFENPPVLDEYREATGTTRDNPNPVFTSQIYDFIKDLKVSHVTSNPYIITKRENLKKAGKVEEAVKNK